MKYLKTLKKYLGSKYVEPALNHEMVRAVLSERQTTDSDAKCREAKRGVIVHIERKRKLLLFLYVIVTYNAAYCMTSSN